MTKNSDILKVVGINSKGFGNIPKLVMQDRRITPEAKCIYGYFASYAGMGNSAFPSVSKIMYDLCMGNNRYYKHFKLLTDHGYVTVEQAKQEGKFSHNIYILNTQVADEKAPSLQNDDTAKPSLQNGYTGNRETQNEDTNTNSFKINSLKEEEEDQTEKFPKQYIKMALRVGANKSDLAVALKKMDQEVDIKSSIAWLQTALENEVMNRELASRPKTKKDPKPSTKPHAVKLPKTDPSKYDNFYL